SLCCITPVLALLAGTSGVASTFSWVEPFRPYLIGLTILVLAFAWYRQLRPKTPEELECACDEEEKTSFWQSKKFLGIVTVFAALMLVFPYYSSIFYPENKSNTTFAMSDNIKEITVDVKGMTCSGCEQSIEHAVGQLEGVNSVKASYDSGTATINFSPSLVSDKHIVEAINGTGYQVVKEKRDSLSVSVRNENISFYKVPLVCNAAPTIGCGSRSKPVLSDLEKAKGVTAAWLNRSGTIIAIVWEEGTDAVLMHTAVSRIFEKHQLGAKELSNDEYSNSYQSFSIGKNWLKGSEVDKLSKEEASIIANQIVGAIKEKTKLSSENERKIHQKTTDVFYEFFLNYESLAELGDPNIYKAKLKDIRVYGENLLGEGKMPSLEELWKSCSSAAKSCDHESCYSSCKVPKT
ncbi:MAG: mercuric transport protein MerTP, partial [Aurantibacter sp.]